jgi:hypothetical protein
MDVVSLFDFNGQAGQGWAMFVGFTGIYRAC